MKTKTDMKKQGMFDRFSSTITRAAGNPVAFYSAITVVLVWSACGPFFNYSNTWQLVINTTTTIITFLMVFVIQQSQNKDTMAIQLKLNELIAATQGASNRLIDIEDLTEAELVTIKKFYVKLSDLAEKEEDILGTHSIDEATHKHSAKVNSSKTITSSRVRKKQKKAVD